jgi:uncharacterized repeat protein (TIGR01451 family)
MIDYVAIVTNENGTGCDLTDASVMLFFPAQDGTPEGVKIDLATGASFPSDGSGDTTYPAQTYEVDVNSNVSDITARLEVEGILQDVPGGTPGQGDQRALTAQLVHTPSTAVTITANPTLVAVGGTVDLTITETNDSGDGITSFNNVVVEVDPVGGGTLTAPPDSGDDGNNLLDDGETWQWVIQDVIVNATTVFTATGSGTDGLGTVITFPGDSDEQDMVTVNVSNPDIDIEKATNGEDADNPTGPLLLVGSQVNWTYEVTNIGDTDLINVTVTDDQGVAVTCPQDTLAVGESMTCTANGIAEAGQYANIGTVTGDPVDGSNPVTDSDPSHYFGGGVSTVLIIDVFDMIL